MEKQFDVIGSANAAELRCAGGMILQGERLLVTPQTKKAAAIIRLIWLDEQHRGTMQAGVATHLAWWLVVPLGRGAAGFGVFCPQAVSNNGASRTLGFHATE
ncbi:MAG: hypothetical protein JWP42_505 [Pseudomonas sp.]|nr:hypothetical protein [Pseudomonas sp.]